MKSYDAIIIGFGKGGKTLAGALAASGKRVAVVEQSDKMYGGTCINVGCLPSKSLKTSAEKSAYEGGTFEDKAKRYSAAVNERERLTAMLREKNYHKLSDNENIDIINAHGGFVGKNDIRLTFSDGQTKTVTASEIFINTGATPRSLNIKGISDSRFVFSSSGLMELKELPKTLVIIGGGYIGMEFASMYANFGSKVTVIQNEAVFLPREDKEIAEAVLKRLEALGVTVIFEGNTKSIQDENDYTVITVNTKDGEIKLEAEAVLTAVGRIPNTQNLGLEAAGIKINDHGAVITDEHLKTTNPSVYAMGDVVGGLQFTYISLDDFRIVKSALSGDLKRTINNRGEVPYSVFLYPPFSRIGLTEEQARKKGYNIKVASMPASAIPKAQVIKETAGILKAIVDADSEEILGVHLFCAESHEIINIIKTAMDAHLKYTVLRDMIFTHPTMAEGFNDLFSMIK